MAQAVLYRHFSELLTLKEASQKQGRGCTEADLSIEKNYSLAVSAGKIIWCGPDKKIPKTLKAQKEISLKGFVGLPGFVDCHTHLVFAGDRTAEFELRNRGVSYQEISARGGGILSTMRATRKASLGELARLAQERADQALKQGVTTLEFKSGYALNLKDELKMLEVGKKLKGPRLVATFLGAHALPPEFKSHSEYLLFLGDKVLPQVKKKNLASRVDIFIEKGFFEADVAREYLQKAKSLGFDLVIHADQLSLSGGTDLAVELQARSSDHVIQVQAQQIAKLAKSETTAVLLPAADLYMKCSYPPARELIKAGARVALATDFNPGSSPTQDITLVGLLARLEMQMTLSEVITAFTLGGAYALGLQKEIGSLELGKSADFVFSSQGWQSLFYSVGKNWVEGVCHQGRLFVA